MAGYFCRCKIGQFLGKKECENFCQFKFKWMLSGALITGAHSKYFAEFIWGFQTDHSSAPCKKNPLYAILLYDSSNQCCVYIIVSLLCYANTFTSYNIHMYVFVISFSFKFFINSYGIISCTIGVI